MNWRFTSNKTSQQRMARGIEPREARRQAIVALGGVAQVTEQVHDARGVRPLEDFAGDVRHALRLFWASPVFALTVIVVLGGALGAMIALFAVADTTTLLRRALRCHRAPGADLREQLADQSMVVVERRRAGAAGAAAQFRRRWSGASRRRRARRRGRRPNVSVAGFATAGRLCRDRRSRRSPAGSFSADDERESAPPVAVVSHAFAAERFGAAPAIGRDLVVDGVHHTIVGVLPSGVTELAGMRSRIWLPLKIQTPRRRGPFWLRGIGRLRPDVTIDMAAQDLAGISRRIFPLWASSFRDQSAVLLPLPLRDTIDGDAAEARGAVQRRGAARLVHRAGQRRDADARACVGAKRMNWRSVSRSARRGTALRACSSPTVSC